MNHSSALPRQFALDLTQPPPATLHNFLESGNEELKSVLGRSVSFWQTGQERLIPLEQRWFYWWGSNGCGRTHLLKAMSHAARDQGLIPIELGPHQPNAWIDCEDRLSQ